MVQRKGHVQWETHAMPMDHAQRVMWKGIPGMERCKEHAQMGTNVQLWEHVYAEKMIQILRAIVWMREHVLLTGSFAHQRVFALVCRPQMGLGCLVTVQCKAHVLVLISYVDLMGLVVV